MGFLSDYHEWLKICDTALPQNLIGYITSLGLSLLRADPFTLKPYDQPQNFTKCGVGTKSFFREQLSERSGPSPEICKWIAPNRQISQLGLEEMHILLTQVIFNKLATKYSASVVVKTSVLEKAGDALLLADKLKTPHAIAKATKREIAHVHTGRVILKKWGQRMTLAGSFMPQEYLIVYTPRTEEEVKSVKTIVEAAIGFMTGVSEGEE